MTTKKQQKDEAFKVFDAIRGLARKTYDAIRDQADKAYDAIVDPAYQAYNAIVDLARNAYNAKCKEIDEQGEDIRVINGKRYKLIEE